MKLRSVIFLVALNVISGFGQEEYCYANDGDRKQTKHYSTKTPYEVRCEITFSCGKAEVSF